MPAEMTKDQAFRIIETAKLVSGEPLTGSMSGEFTVTHHDEPQIGSRAGHVGKQALFFRGRYLEIGDGESKIEPFGDGISVRYTGDAEVTRVFARHLRGTVIADTSKDAEIDEPPAGSEHRATRSAGPALVSHTKPL